MKYLKLMIHYYKLNFMSFWSYQIDFVAWIIASIIQMFISIININIIFRNIDKINGWSFYEIIFLTSLTYLARFIWHTFLINSTDIGYFIRNGSLDYYLTKPIYSLFQIIVKDRYNYEFDWDDLIGGVLLLCISSANLNISWSAIKVLLLIIVIIFGGITYAGIIIIGSITAFWTVKSSSMVRLLKSSESLSHYPISLYSKPIQYILIYLLPFAFINYFPTLFFLKGGSLTLTVISPLVSTLIWAFVIGFWNYGLSKYQSTGN